MHNLFKCVFSSSDPQHILKTKRNGGKRAKLAKNTDEVAAAKTHTKVPTSPETAGTHKPAKDGV